MLKPKQRGRPRPGLAVALPLFMLAALLSLAPPAGAQHALLTHAEQPARLIRATAVLDARAGVALHPGDIIDTATRTVQIEWTSGALLALGPFSTVLIDDATVYPTVRLLRGWIKVAASGKPAGKLAVAAGALSAIAAGSGVLRVAADKTELFVESGTLVVGSSDRNAPANVTVNREQYAVHRTAQGLVTEPRPNRLFIREMPRAFFDPLVALAARVKPAAPVLLREASVADIAQWGDAPAPVRKQLAARFAPRLSDPAFRAAAETTLAGQPEWRQVLKQNSRQRKPADTTTNHLF